MKSSVAHFGFRDRCFCDLALLLTLALAVGAVYGLGFSPC